MLLVFWIYISSLVFKTTWNSIKTKLYFPEQLNKSADKIIFTKIEKLRDILDEVTQYSNKFVRVYIDKERGLSVSTIIEQRHGVIESFEYNLNSYSAVFLSYFAFILTSAIIQSGFEIPISSLQANIALSVIFLINIFAAKIYDKFWNS